MLAHDVKLRKLLCALEMRLDDSACSGIVMRHLAQLRYYLIAALKWVPGSQELTSHARGLTPVLYIVTKRILSVVRGKEAALRREHVLVEHARPIWEAGAPSIVSTVDTEGGSSCHAIVGVDEDPTAQIEIGNMIDAVDCLTIDREYQQRRLFYSQCMAVKLRHQNTPSAKNMLLADLYHQAIAEQVPAEDWTEWIKRQVNIAG